MEFRGGTHDAAVPPSAWDMGPGLTIRYDRPSNALAPFVSAYFVYRAASPEPKVDWFLPAGPMLCVLVEAGPVEVAVGPRRFASPPDGFLLGTTSRAYRSLTHGGALVGVSLSPGGWARLTRRRLSDFTDVLAPLSAVLGADAGDLVAAVRALPDDAALKGFFDARLPALLGTPRPDDAPVAALSALLTTDGISEVGQVAARMGLSPDALRALSLRCFGLTPKRLLRRARFLRSLVTHLDDQPGRRAVDSSYHDESHFLRDSDDFLGTTPRRFLQKESDFLRASVRLRTAVLGAPAMALHRAPPPETGAAIREAAE